MATLLQLILKFIHNKVKNTVHTAGEMVAFVVTVINTKNFKPFYVKK